jgi:hypothetical protein
LLLPIISGTLIEGSGASGAKGPPGNSLPSITGLKPSRRRSAKGRTTDARQHLDLRFEELRRRQFPKLAGIGRLQPQMLQHLACGPGAVLAIGHLDGRSALDDGLVEQAFGRRHGHQHADFRAAARFPEDGDVVGITAELGDVVSHPFKGRNDVEDTREACMLEAFGRVFHMEVAQRTQPMVERDDHHIVEAAEIGAVRPGRRTRPGDERAAMAPEQDRSLRTCPARCPDVEIETILVELLLPGEGEQAQQIVGQCEDVLALHRHVAIVEGVPDSAPRTRPARRPEAQLAERRLGIRNTLENLDTAIADAADFPGSSLDDDLCCHGVQCTANGPVLINLSSGTSWP